MIFHRTLAAAALLAACSLTAAMNAQESQSWPQHSRSRPAPPVEVAPPQSLPVAPPAGAIVLFDGKDLSRWHRADGENSPAGWIILPDGAMEVAPGSGDIETRDAFGDVRLHVEWASPSPAIGEDQDRGNSGVFLMGRYEVQVLDSYGSATYPDGQAGAIYGQFPPRLNVSRAPGEWQSFDIEFRAPRFGADGALASPARLTVLHNGVLVHDDVALLGPTSHRVRARYEAHAAALPVKLQDHGHRVHFRNIWLQPLASEK
ncbi:MAG: 3-keto-disaccharide hydrolase [Gemmatimonadaceae bacterium]